MADKRVTILFEFKGQSWSITLSKNEQVEGTYQDQVEVIKGFNKATQQFGSELSAKFGKTMDDFPVMKFKDYSIIGVQTEHVFIGFISKPADDSDNQDNSRKALNELIKSDLVANLFSSSSESNKLYRSINVVPAIKEILKKNKLI